MTGARSRGSEVFKASKASAPRPATNAVDTLIGRQTEVQGDIRFTGGLHVDGRIKGKVIATSDKSAVLSISESGAVEGDVRVPNVVLNGSVTGDVHASERLSLNNKARITGNVYYKVVEMASGATVNGQMIHEGEASLQSVTHEAKGIHEIVDPAANTGDAERDARAAPTSG